MTPLLKLCPAPWSPPCARTSCVYSTHVSNDQRRRVFSSCVWNVPQFAFGRFNLYLPNVCVSIQTIFIFTAGMRAHLFVWMFCFFDPSAPRIAGSGSRNTTLHWARKPPRTRAGISTIPCLAGKSSMTSWWRSRSWLRTAMD